MSATLAALVIPEEKSAQLRCSRAWSHSRAPSRFARQKKASKMAKRNGNRELKKPKQTKAKSSSASSVAELAKIAKSSAGK